jgi:hypothetical protein
VTLTKTDMVAMCFGDHVWPILVRVRFLARSRRPSKLQLALYRKWLRLKGRIRA